MAAALETEDAPTSNRTSARSRPIEVITRGERRRRWTVEEKRAIAAESLQPGASPVMVARKHGISSGLLYTWRQQLLCGAPGGAPAPRFVRVDVVAPPTQPQAAAPALGAPATPVAPPPPTEPDGRIEIMLAGGATVRVDAAVNEGALRRVLAALERSS